MEGGRVYPQDTIDEICDEAHTLGVPVHMDGARVFNAAEASGKSVARIVQKVDTVMFCLSKALGAPAGSMLAGRKPLIDKARLLRKRLGGGMRQVGVLAAPALLALEESPKGLGQDHANAQLLAERLRTIDGIRVFPVETNIVIFDVSSTRRHPRDISRDLREQGVLINGLNDRLMRAVTHYGVSTAQCSEAMERLESLCVSAAREGILR
jgi:threonine aldolase